MSELRIIPAEIEAQVAARRREIDGCYIGGRKGGRPPGQNVKYLLVGLLTCGVCGGTMEVVTSEMSGGRRLISYQCCTSRRKGMTVCANRQPAPIADAHEAVIDKVGKIIGSSRGRARADVCAERHQRRRQRRAQGADDEPPRRARP